MKPSTIAARRYMRGHLAGIQEAYRKLYGKAVSLSFLSRQMHEPTDVEKINEIERFQRFFTVVTVAERDNGVGLSSYMNAFFTSVLDQEILSATTLEDLISKSLDEDRDVVKAVINNAPLPEQIKEAVEAVDAKRLCVAKMHQVASTGSLKLPPAAEERYAVSQTQAA